MDNKYWLPEASAEATNGYERVLDPPLSRRDVAYWLNALGGPAMATVNCAVEESTLAARNAALLPQDVFIRDHIARDDVLVVSVGGNDVALHPTLSTLWNVLKGVFLNQVCALRASPSTAWGMPYFRTLFRDTLQRYIERLVEKTAPRVVVVCMIYFPDETCAESWAATTLRLLMYDSRPAKLQALIEAVYACATQGIIVDGTAVVACPLFHAMNGKDTALYVARVEPSEAGGEAVARLLLSCVDLCS